MYSSPYRPDIRSDALSPFYPIGLSPELNRPSDHSPHSTAKIKNARVIPPLPLRLHGVVLK